MSPEERDEITIALNKLNLESFKGCALKCPECKKEGHFGSMSLYTCDSGIEYLLCGWCKKEFEHTP
jgi:hypothetical protein